MNKDPYETLGISSNASKEEIKKVYRRLAHQYHPDKNNGDDRKFKEINEAYHLLAQGRDTDGLCLENLFEDLFEK